MHFPLHLTHLTDSTPGDGSQHGHLFSGHSASPSAGEEVVERERERRGSASVGKDEEQEPEQEQEQKRKQEQREEEEEEEEEEVSEWIEGKDIVIERKSCIPGEDVQVEVLKGAAVVVEGGERERERMVREAKERMRKKGKEAEGKW